MALCEGEEAGVRENMLKIHPPQQLSDLEQVLK